MKSKLIVQDLWLKPTLKPHSVWSYDKNVHGGYVADFKNISEDIRVVGTREQIDEWFKESQLELKDLWNVELTENHKKLYKRNCEKIVFIHLI